jgi:hypothetical protein
MCQRLTHHTHQERHDVAAAYLLELLQLELVDEIEEHVSVARHPAHRGRRTMVRRR